MITLRQSSSTSLIFSCKLTLCLPVCLCQEISGITEALAKELFHKGLLAFLTLTSFSNLGFTLLTINMSVAVGDIISSGHDVPNLYFLIAYHCGIIIDYT